MKTFEFVDSIYDFTFQSAPQYSKERHSLFLVQTSMDQSKDDYHTRIVEFNLDDGEEVVWVDNGYKNIMPSLQNHKLLYVSNVTGTNQVFMMDLENGEQQQVTFSDYNVHSPQWMNGTTQFVYGTLVPRENVVDYSEKQAPVYRFDRTQYFYDVTGFVNDDLKPSLVIQDVYDYKSEVVAEVFSGSNLNNKFSTSPSGRYVVYENQLNFEDATDFSFGVFVYDRKTKKTQHVTEEYDSGMFMSPQFSPDGRYIAMTGSLDPAMTPTHPSLFVYDTQEQKLVNLTPQAEIDFSNHALNDFFYNAANNSLQWAPDSKSFYAVASEEGDVVLYNVSLDGELKKCSKEFMNVKEYIVAANGDVYGSVSSYNEPSGVYCFDQSNWEKMEVSESDYSHYHFGEYKKVEYTAEDGGRIPGYVVTPHDFDENKKYPLLLNIHGGPNMMHSSNFYHEVQHQAAKGYVVMLMNPRGSYGYGQEHVMGSYGRFGAEDFTDLMTAVDHFVAEARYVDQDRMFVTGGSYGGYMTNWIVTHDHRFKAAVTQRSVSNLISMLGTSEIGQFFYKDMAGVDISEPEKLWDKSPLKYVQNVETPLLVMHAVEDYLTPFGQAQEFYAALKKYDKKAEMLAFPDSDHELSRSGRPSYRVIRLNAMMEWFERYDEVEVVEENEDEK